MEISQLCIFKWGNPQHPSSFRLPILHLTTFLLGSWRMLRVRPNSHLNCQDLANTFCHISISCGSWSRFDSTNLYHFQARVFSLSTFRILQFVLHSLWNTQKGPLRKVGDNKQDVDRRLQKVEILKMFNIEVLLLLWRLFGHLILQNRSRYDFVAPCASRVPQVPSCPPRGGWCRVGVGMLGGGGDPLKSK